MKRFLAILFLVGFKLGAQNLNVAQHSQVDVTKNLVSINSKCYYPERIGSYCCDDSVNLVALSNTGQTLFKKKFYFPGYTWNVPVKVIKTKDNCLLLFGRSTQACDLVATTNFIIKADTNGNIIFQNYINLNQTAFNILSGDVTQHTDSSYYFISLSDVLYHYSKTGQFGSVFSTSITGMNSISTLTNGNLIINGKIGGVLKNIELTTSNTIVNQQNCPDSIRKFIQSSSGIIYALTNSGIIQTFSTNLQAINCSTISFGSGNKIKDFDLRNDSIFCTGYLSPLNKAFYVVFNPALNIVYGNQSTYKNIYPTGIALNNKNKVNIVSYGTSNINTQMTFKGVYQLPITGSLSSKYDVGILNYSVLSSSLVFINSGEYSIFTNMNVTIKNFGTDTIKSFYVNNYGPNLLIWCPGLLHKLYYNTIAPGNTISVPTGTFYAKILQVPFPPGVPVNKQVCLSTSVPNFENDVEINNDDWCDSIMVTKPVGIKENNLSDIEIKISPNPFENTLNIESDLEIKKVELYNPLGMLVEKTIVNSKKIKLDHAELSPGIYILKIETEKGSIVKKVIKN